MIQNKSIKVLICLSVFISVAFSAPPPPYSVYLPFVARSSSMAITYQLITPDGTTFNFSGTGYDIVPNIPDGFGFPPVQHTVNQVYQRPGAILQDINIMPRIVTITSALYASSQETLHAARAALMAALRWNRDDGNPPAPSKLRYSANGHSADLYVYYMSDVLGAVGKSNNMQLMGIRLIAYDPLWYSSTETTTGLAVANLFDVKYVIGKIAGAWNDMKDVGTGDVWAIAFGPDGDSVYVGGHFANWPIAGGAMTGDCIVKYTISTDTWSMVGDGLTGSSNYVFSIAIGADGTIYAGGSFTAAGVGGAVSNIAMFIPAAGSWFPMAAGMNDWVRSIVIDKNGVVYAAGEFTTPFNYVASWDPAGHWDTLAGGMDGDVYSLCTSPDGKLYAGGLFATAGGVTAARVAVWNGTAWAALDSGLNADVYALALSQSGILYIGGAFTTAGGIAASKIASWNGASYSALGAGVNGAVWKIAVSDTGLVYACGAFTTAGGSALMDRVAVWDGTAWAQLGIDLPATNVWTVAVSGNDVYIGFDAAGNAAAAANTNVSMQGSYDIWPTFEVTGPGTLQWIENTTTGKTMLFNCYLSAGETATIAPEDSTITSSQRGDLLPYAVILPQSDFGNFVLASSPVAPSGLNSIAVFMSGTTPVSQNDTSGPASAAQLDDWEDVTGVDCDNTDTGGQMYVSIIDDTGGFFHVALYDDSVRTHLVGHTATYNAATDPLAIVADNTSGLGGHIKAVSATAADADIVVFFATCCESHYDAFLTVDEAVD